LKTSPYKKFALLIGVADYGSADEDLPFCEDDVIAMERVLSRKGFNCSTRVSKPLRPIIDEKILQNIVNQASDFNDTIIFYFSGHGVDIGGEQILQGKGGKTANLTYALNYADLLLLSDVLTILSTTPAQKIVIIDACRIAKNLTDDELRNIQPLLRERIKAIQQIQNCVIAFSSADGQKSFGLSSGDGSRFTSCLVEELQGYGQDFLSIVRNTLIALRAGNHIKNQTPWVYSSTSDNRAVDRFKVLKQVPGHDDTTWIRLIAPSHAGVYGLTQYGGLVQLTNGRWKKTGSIARLSDATKQLEMSSDGRVFAVFAKNSIYFGSAISQNPEASNKNSVKLGSNRISPYDIGLFGFALATDGTLIVAFGTPHEHNKAGLRAWNIDSNRSKSTIELVNLPKGLQCNSVLIVDDHFYATFSEKDNTRISIWRFDRQEKNLWFGNQYHSGLASRITAMSIDKKNNVLYLGAEDGSIGIHIMGEIPTLNFFPRKHMGVSESFYGKKTWLSKDSDHSEMPVAVKSISVMEEYQIVGIAYYDATISFFDPVLGTYVASFDADRHSRNLRLVTGGVDWMYASIGIRGARFELDNV